MHKMDDLDSDPEDNKIPAALNHSHSARETSTHHKPYKSSLKSQPKTKVDTTSDSDNSDILIVEENVGVKTEPVPSLNLKRRAPLIHKAGSFAKQQALQPLGFGPYTSPTMSMKPEPHSSMPPPRLSPKKQSAMAPPAVPLVKQESSSAVVKKERNDLFFFPSQVSRVRTYSRVVRLSGIDWSYSPCRIPITRSFSSLQVRDASPRRYVRVPSLHLLRH